MSLIQLILLWWWLLKNISIFTTDSKIFIQISKLENHKKMSEVGKGNKEGREGFQDCILLWSGLSVQHSMVRYKYLNISIFRLLRSLSSPLVRSQFWRYCDLWKNICPQHHRLIHLLHLPDDDENYLSRKVGKYSASQWHSYDIQESTKCGLWWMECNICHRNIIRIRTDWLIAPHTRIN